MLRAVPLAFLLVQCIGLFAGDTYFASVAKLREHMTRTFGGPVTPGVPEVPFALPDDVIGRVKHETSPLRGEERKLARVLGIILSRWHQGLRYDPLATLTAREVLEQGRGNCLSLTNLIVGLTRAAGLDSVYVHVNDVERYRGRQPTARDRDAVIHSTHICAAIRHGASIRLVDLASVTSPQYHDYAPITDDEALAYFLTNRAYEIECDSPGMEPSAREAAGTNLLRFALALKPNFIPALNNLGAAYRRQGDLARALESVQTALDLNPSFAEAYSNRAAIYQEMGRLNDAVTDLRMAVRLADANPFFHYALGCILLDSGQAPDAELSFRKALDSRRLPIFLIGLVRSLLAENRADEACNVFGEALRSTNSTPDAASIWAAAARNAGPN